KNKQDLNNPLQALKREQIGFILKVVHEDPIFEHLGEKTMVDKIEK
ncbi:36769_t:CDS:1, partial [Gigaspora margarita]